MRRVVIHIDSLVLKGFRHEDRHGIAEGLQQELSRLLARPEMAARVTGIRGVPRLRVGNVEVDHGSRPQHVGERVAQSIGKGVQS